MDIGGKTIQNMFFHGKSGELSLALLIHPVPMDERQSRIVDGREGLRKVMGQVERFGVPMQLSHAGNE